MMAWKVPTLAGSQRLVDEHRHDGRVRQLLPQARDRRPARPRREPAEDAIYPLNIGDENGRPLDGASKYTIHFDKEALPPVDAFWSITLYDQEGYQVANGLNRFAVSSWMRSSTTRTAPSTSTSRPEPGRRQGGELAAGADGNPST